jgi:DMSO/TMAO reductase YedYZ heme-binding membrane subunit
MNLNSEGKILLGTIIALYILIITLFLMTPIGGILNGIVRLCALLGVVSIFIATIMTSFMVEFYKIFKKPFIKIHHIFSILGIMLITIHPITYAIQVINISVFVPVFYPWYTFWALAGRPALIFIYLALISVVLRKKIPKLWRPLHGLNYIALLFGYIHGILIGTDFKNIGILIIFTIMVILSYCSLVYKRYQIYQRIQRKKKIQTQEIKTV